MRLYYALKHMQNGITERLNEVIADPERIKIPESAYEESQEVKRMSADSNNETAKESAYHPCDDRHQSGDNAELLTTQSCRLLSGIHGAGRTAKQLRGVENPLRGTHPHRAEMDACRHLRR